MKRFDFIQIKDFFERLNFKNLGISVILVTHLLPDRYPFLEALDKIAEVIAIIPKKKSLHLETLHNLEKKYNILHISRENIINTNIIEKIIMGTTNKIILIDIGGYFAPIIHRLYQAFGERIIGVVEDTENGQQKYQSLENLPIPVFSVARSPLKNQEDYLVGQSIFYSTEVLLRELNLLPNYLQVGILGFGKIGQSVADSARYRSTSVSVYDTNPLLRVNAYCRGYRIPDKDQLLETCDLIISCTGNKAITTSELKKVKDGSFIAAATSADDEFDFTDIDKYYIKRPVNEHTTEIIDDNKTFFLFNEGNAVNFLHNAVVGDFIFLVQAEIIEAIQYLVKNKCNLGLQELSLETRKTISEKWIESVNKRFDNN